MLDIRFGFGSAVFMNLYFMSRGLGFTRHGLESSHKSYIILLSFA